MFTLTDYIVLIIATGYIFVLILLLIMILAIAWFKIFTPR